MMERDGEAGIRSEVGNEAVDAWDREGRTRLRCEPLTKHMLPDLLSMYFE
jgi:hypothetical protein